jgi:hypothetical protein
MKTCALMAQLDDFYRLSAKKLTCLQALHFGLMQSSVKRRRTGCLWLSYGKMKPIPWEPSSCTAWFTSGASFQCLVYLPLPVLGLTEIHIYTVYPAHTILQQYN